MATDKQQMRRGEGTIKPVAVVKEGRKKMTGRTTSSRCPTRSFATSPRIAPWGVPQFE